MNDDKVNQIINLLKRAEVNPRAEEHLRVFLFKAEEDLELQGLIDLFVSNPDAFDHFVNCFQLKRRSFEYGATQADWEHLFEEERKLLQVIA